MLKIWRIHAETSCSKYRHFVMKMQKYKWSYTFSQAKRNIHIYIHVPEIFIHVAIQHSYHTQSSG